MNLSVFKDSVKIKDFDLGKEVEGSNGSSSSFYLGRSKSCLIHLDDQMISREQAEITFESNKWFIVPLSNYGNLSINGARVTERTELKNGDSVSIANYSLKIDLPEIEIQPVEEDAILPSEEVGEEAPEEASFEEESSEESIEESSEEQLEEDASSDGETDDEFNLGESEEGEESEQEEADSDGFEGEEESFEVEDDFDSDDAFAMDTVDDGFDDDDDDSSDSTQVIQAFATFRIELDGEHAPYDQITLEKNETIIGRDPEKCDIVLNDAEVSSTHAVLKKTAISCVLEDLNSGNGTLLNGQRINQSELTNGDEFIIGTTTFTVRIVSDFLQQEQSRLMPVEENQVVEVEEIVEVDENFDDTSLDLIEGGASFGVAEGGGADAAPDDNSLLGKFKALPRKKKIIYGSVGALLLLMLLDDGSSSKKTKAIAEANKKKKSRLLKEKQAAKNQSKTALMKKLSPEDIEFVDSTYQLAKELNKNGKYSEAMYELEKIFQKAGEYKNSRQLYEIAKEGVKELELIAKKEREEREKKERQLKVKQLVEKAREATKERQVELAENLFSQIIALDPENFEVTQFKLDLNAYKKEQERISVAAAEKKAERDRQEGLLKPGKSFYQKKDWYGAIKKLEEFLNQKGLDDDLVESGNQMLAESRENLENIVQPLLGKARSLKEGQDLKGSYEHYREILKADPNRTEALNEMNEIRDRLTNRSRKIYREAIISESLSLFEDAKEKFQEVQQVSPSDSEYYIKASQKLKDYLE